LNFSKDLPRFTSADKVLRIDAGILQATSHLKDELGRKKGKMRRFKGEKATLILMQKRNTI